MDKILQAILFLVTAGVSHAETVTVDPENMPVQIGMPPNMPPFMSSIPKLPVIVMPFYTPQGKFSQPPKKKKPKKDKDESTCDSDESEDSENYDGEHRKKKVKTKGKSKRRKLRKYAGVSRRSGRLKKAMYGNFIGELTPVIQYVGETGNVIFEKKITDREAEDWLDMTPDSRENKNHEENNNNDEESYKVNNNNDDANNNNYDEQDKSEIYSPTTTTTTTTTTTPPPTTTTKKPTTTRKWNRSQRMKARKMRQKVEARKEYWRRIS